MVAGALFDGNATLSLRCRFFSDSYFGVACFSFSEHLSTTVLSGLALLSSFGGRITSFVVVADNGSISALSASSNALLRSVLSFGAMPSHESGNVAGGDVVGGDSARCDEFYVGAGLLHLSVMQWSHVLCV